MDVPGPLGKPAAEVDARSKTLVHAFGLDCATPMSPEELFWNHRII